jgi:3-hydroxybutyryl-CoA dehydrogenase
MGRGLAQLLVRGDCSVVVLLRRPPSGSQLSSRVTFTTQAEGLAGCHLVIEAISESLPHKQDVFKALDHVCPSPVIFASCTSSLSITALMSTTSSARHRNFFGLHFFNPVATMRLVELTRTVRSDPGVESSLKAFVEKLGKVVIATQDRPGFIVNRLLIAYLLDAIRMVEHGEGKVQDIDEGLRLGCGYPMGPFQVTDLIGLDVVLEIADRLFEQTKDTRFAPPPLLRQMVGVQLLGRKTHEGFYKY